MRVNLVLFLAFATIFFGCSKGIHFTLQKPDQKKFAVPPGGVRIGDQNFFIDETEVSNIDYLEFLYWLERVHGSESTVYASALPDTSVWGAQQIDGSNLKEVYLKHPRFSNYPVLGVSYQQVLDYCHWRTDRVLEVSLIVDGKIDPNTNQNPDNYFTATRYLKGQYLNYETPEKVAFPVYRLPTESEWETAASYQADSETQLNGWLPKESKIAKYQRKDPNWNVFMTSENAKDGGNAPRPVSEGPKTPLGTYNLIGNAAEMLIFMGKAKGGSWEHSLEEAKISERLSYKRPTKWLGFRCVAEYISGEEYLKRYGN